MFKNSSRPMTVAEATRFLHMEHRAIEESVKDFANANIMVVDKEGACRYSPSGTLADSIDETAKMYNERRTAVINFIYAGPMRSFSDAFRLTGEE